MAEVFAIDIDLSKLQEAVKLSNEVQKNMAGKGKTNKNATLDNFKKQNKELKTQNALLKNSLKTLQLIRMTAKGIVGLGALGLGAIAGISVSGFSNATKNNRRFKGIGINERQGYSLNFASQMAGLDEDSLTSAAEKLQEALRDVNKAKDIALLGLDPDDLANMNSVDALMKVFQTAGNHEFFGEKSEYALKEAMESVTGGFTEFRTLLGVNTDEIKKYYKEGMAIYKDNYENLKDGDQSLIRLKNQFNRIRLLLATKFEPLITKILEKILPYIEKYGDEAGNAVGNAVDGIIKWTKDINKETGRTNLEQLFVNLKNFADNMHWFWQKLEPILNPLARGLVNFGKFLLNNSITRKLMTAPEQTENYERLKKEFEKNYLKGGDAAVQTSLQNIKEEFEESGLELYQYRDLLKHIKKKLDPKQDTFGKLVQNYDNSRKKLDEMLEYKAPYEVDDAVITKDGKVIKTSPQDYLFATKTPQALATGGSYNININATVRNDNDIYKIKYELDRLLKSINAGR